MMKQRGGSEHYLVFLVGSAFLTCALIVCQPAGATQVFGWYEDGSSYDYHYYYNYELHQDFGDPWKTVGTWANRVLTPKQVTAHVEASKSVTIQVGWEEIIVAVLSIQKTIKLSQDVPYTIPACTKTSTAQWRWLGDYITEGAVTKYNEDRSEYISGWELKAGYYNYSPEFSDLEIITCTDPPCPEPSTLALLAVGGLVLLRRRRG